MLLPKNIPDQVRAPLVFLMCLSFTNWLSFAAWQALLNNFVVESSGFQWAEIGITQSVREIPGLLAFTALFWLAISLLRNLISSPRSVSPHKFT